VQRLVLIPGLLCNRRLWTAQIAVLSAHADIYVPEITSQATVAQMASDILTFVRGQFSLAGFSLGSQVALQVMEFAPHRIERLALLSATHGGLPPPVQGAIRDAILTIQHGGFGAYLEAAYSAYVSAAHARDGQIKRCFMEMAEEVGPAAGLRQMKALLGLKEPFRHLGAISCPTVVIGGSEDSRITPAAHELLAHAIPNASLVLIEHAAHFTPLEQPSQVTAELKRWMERPSAK
jgi:pimeloyl-ACP methyl ester carboxylesterase